MDAAALSAALMTARAEARRTPNTLVRKESGGVKLVWQVIQQRGQPAAELLRLDGETWRLVDDRPDADAAVRTVLELLPVELLLESHTHKPGMLGLVMRTERDRRRCLKCDWNTASSQKGARVNICSQCSGPLMPPYGYGDKSLLTREEEK